MSENKNWVVVHDGTTKYVGVVGGATDGYVELTEAFELVLLRMPQQTREGVAIATAVNAMPIGLAGGFTRIRVHPSAVELFSEMDARDSKSYERLVEDTRERFAQIRAEASGIVLPSRQKGS